MPSDKPPFAAGDLVEFKWGFDSRHPKGMRATVDECYQSAVKCQTGWWVVVVIESGVRLGQLDSGWFCLRD